MDLGNCFLLYGRVLLAFHDEHDLSHADHHHACYLLSRAIDDRNGHLYQLAIEVREKVFVFHLIRCTSFPHLCIFFGADLPGSQEVPLWLVLTGGAPVELR